MKVEKFSKDSEICQFQNEHLNKWTSKTIRNEILTICCQFLAKKKIQSELLRMSF